MKMGRRRNGRRRRGISLAAGRAYAREIAKVIARSMRPAKVVLFGSFAYGRPTDDSDLDILVVARGNGAPHKRAGRLHNLFLDRPIGIDFVVMTPAEVRRRLSGFDPFLEEVLEKGIVLHADAN